MIHKITIPVLGATSGGGGTDPGQWQSPMTSPGDLIVGGAAGTPLRLPVNASATKKLLTSVNNSTAWQTVSSLYNNASYTALIGDGVNTTINITHNMGTESILAGIWEATGLKRSVECTVSIISDNVITLHFTTPPATDSLRLTLVSSIFSSAVHSTPELPNQTGKNSKFLMTNGMLVSWEETLPSQVGNTGKVLTTDGNTPSWLSAFPDQASNADKFLMTNGTTVSWSYTPIWMTNPMNSPGDLIIGGTLGAAGRLALGTDHQSLTVFGTTVVWKTLVPAMSSGTIGKTLTNDGTNTLWQTFYQIPSIGGGTTNQILSNDGSLPQWINNTNPPNVTGQSGKFLGNDGTNSIWYSIYQVPSVAGNGGKILTNDGGSYTWQNLTSVMPSVTGNSSKFLTTDGTNISWAVPPSGFANPMTAVADLIVGGASGTATTLAHGGQDQVLTSLYSAGTWSLGWSSVLLNPMTTAGDIIFGGTSGVPQRLAAGTSGYFLQINGSTLGWAYNTVVPTPVGHNGQWLSSNGTTSAWANIPDQLPTQTSHNGHYLTTDGTNPSWATIPSGFANPMNTLGDIISAQTGGTAGRIGIGSTGQVLTVVAGGPAWAANVIGLPTQTGYNGRHLYTDGTNASWVQLSQVPSVTGNSGKFLGNNGSSYSWLDVPNQLPSVTGNSGKYLSNNGTSSTWVPYTGLPDQTGNSGKILTTDGSAAFWQSSSGGSATVLSLIPITVVSSTLTVLAKETKTVDITCKTAQILKITSDYACRIRIYATADSASADYNRLASLDPTGNHKMYLELILTSSNLTWTTSPVPTCSNGDVTRSTNIYITIENTSTSNTAITLNFDFLKME